MDFLFYSVRLIDQTTAKTKKKQNLIEATNPQREQITIIAIYGVCNFYKTIKVLFRMKTVAAEKFCQ